MKSKLREEIKEWVLRYLSRGDRVSINKMRRAVGIIKSRRELLRLLKEIDEVCIEDKIYIAPESLQSVRERFTEQAQGKDPINIPVTAQQSRLNVQIMKEFTKNA